MPHAIGTLQIKQIAALLPDRFGNMSDRHLDKKVLCGWVTQPGDINGKAELQQAFDLGRSIK